MQQNTYIAVPSVVKLYMKIYFPTTSWCSATLGF